MSSDLSVEQGNTRLLVLVEIGGGPVLQIYLSSKPPSRSFIRYIPS